MKENLSNRAVGYPNGSLQAEKQSRMFLRAASATVANIADEKNAAKVFPIRITNNDTDSKLIVLHPGALTLAEIATVLGVQADAIAKEGVVITDEVECTTKVGSTMEYFQKFVNRNPTRITRIQVSATTEEQLDNALIFSGINPFARIGVQEIVPSVSKKETNTNSKLVTLTFQDLQLDDQTVWYTTINAGCTLNLNLFTGAVANSAETLAKQAQLYFAGE